MSKAIKCAKCGKRYFYMCADCHTPEGSLVAQLSEAMPDYGKAFIDGLRRQVSPCKV